MVDWTININYLPTYCCDPPQKKKKKRRQSVILGSLNYENKQKLQTMSFDIIYISGPHTDKSEAMVP